MTFAELTREEDDEETTSLEYASTDETFLKQYLVHYTMDECHALIQILCCNIRQCANFLNPLYSVMFFILFVTVLPGAALHWLLLSCIPVRRKEIPEERELRSQGIYAAIGVAIFGIVFGALGLYVGDQQMFLVNEVSLYVNCSILSSSLIGLKAMGDELIYTIRLFAVGAWIIDLFLIGLALVDAYSFLTVSWLSIMGYALRLYGIFIYTVVAIQCISLWDAYKYRKNTYIADTLWVTLLALIYIGVICSFLLVIIISEENAWRIIYF